MAKTKLVSVPNKTFSVVLMSFAFQNTKAKYRLDSKEKAYHSILSSE
jgi:hypothetical protein